MTTKRIIATVITVIVALIMLGMAISIFQNVSAMATPPEEVVEEEKTLTKESEIATNLKKVQAMAVKNKNIKSGFTAQGRLRAYDKVDLVAEVPGMMKPMEKRFKIGTNFSKDEVIFEVDDAEARLALKAQRAQVHTVITQMMPDLKIDMPDSYNNWKNYLDKFDVNRNISAFPKPLSDREEYYVSSKGLHAQYYNIKSSELRLTKYQVRAPFNGTITNVMVGESGYLRAGVALGTIMNTSKYELEAAVPVSDLKFIKKGSSVKVVSDDSDKSWTGTVKRIGDLVDANTQTATVYIGLSGSGLREGQYLRAEIKTSALNQAFEIPRNLLINQDKVYLVKDGIIVLSPVQIIKIDGDNAIVKGLPDNSLLLTEGIPASMEGEKVIPVQ